MSAKEPRYSLDYDEVLEYIGQFGNFQKKIVFWMCLLQAAGGLAVVAFAFTGGFIQVISAFISHVLTGLEPKYRCRVPLCDTLPVGEYYGLTTKEGMELPAWYRNKTIGINDRCRVPIVKEKGGFCEEGGTFFSYDDGIACDIDDLVFERSIMRNTIIEEFQLLCGRWVCSKHEG